MIAAWIIFMRYVDIYMLVTPEFASDGANLHMAPGEHASHFFVSWLDLAAPLANRRAVDVDVRGQSPAASDAGLPRSVPARVASKLRRPLMAEHHSAGHHSSPDDEYAFTPEGAAYEHTDAAVAPVAKFLFWLFVRGRGHALWPGRRLQADDRPGREGRAA
jgi:hypothetical protein